MLGLLAVILFQGTIYALWKHEEYNKYQVTELI